MGIHTHIMNVGLKNGTHFGNSISVFHSAGGQQNMPTCPVPLYSCQSSSDSDSAVLSFRLTLLFSLFFLFFFNYFMGAGAW